jgi:thiol-disulfide isomerase/thioredoxin
VTTSATRGPSAWRVARLRRVTRRDQRALFVLFVLATLTVIAGRRAATVLTPRDAIQMQDFLDDLDVPRRLPNAEVVDASGSRMHLFDAIHARKAVVTFYAPWCGPCQKELPQLVSEIGPLADIVIVVSGDEELEPTRRQLANLGLTEKGFYVDVNGDLTREGRVTALPTTFLVTAQGAVVQRARGFSHTWLWQLKRKLGGTTP